MSIRPDDITSFLSANRESGSTTALTEVMKSHPDAVLLVHDARYSVEVNQRYLNLPRQEFERRVFYPSKLSVRGRGISTGPILIDTTFVYALCEDLSKSNSERDQAERKIHNLKSNVESLTGKLVGAQAKLEMQKGTIEDLETVNGLMSERIKQLETKLKDYENHSSQDRGH